MATALADALDRASRAFGLHLTVVGHHDRLHRDGRVLIGSRQQSHRTQRVCDLGFGPQCTAHCRWQVNHRLAWRPQPFATRCWKGLREIAVPIRCSGHHLGTLYAGTWRQASPPRSTAVLPEAWAEEWRRLPLWEDGLLDRYGAVLALFADGLALRLSAELADGRGGGRDHGTRIRMWMQLHAHTQVGLADCAEHLGLSLSRTGALVRQHCGAPFALVRRRHRLARACQLLQGSDDPVAAIARSCGFEDPAWFSRAFTAAYGCSPRDWRRRPAAVSPAAGAAGRRRDAPRAAPASRTSRA